MNRKTLKARKKVVHYEDMEINLQLLVESIPKTIDYRTTKGMEDFGIQHNNEYLAIQGIEVDELVVDEPTNQAAILFHVIADGSKYHALFYYGYEGRDMSIYSGHQVHWNHTEYQNKQEITFDDRCFIAGTKTTHVKIVWDKIVGDQQSWEREYHWEIVEESCTMYDLHHFFNNIFGLLGLDD